MEDATISYEQHLKFLEVVKLGAAAEYMGFRDAQFQDEPQECPNPQYQSRYDQGFRDGKAKMMQEQVSA